MDNIPGAIRRSNTTAARYADPSIHAPPLVRRGALANPYEGKEKEHPTIGCS